MKEQFDRYQDGMTASERAEVWERLQGAFAAGGAARRAAGARDARRERDARAREDGARRAMLWPAYRLAGSLAVGVVAVGVAVAVYQGGRGDHLAREGAGELAPMGGAANRVETGSPSWKKPGSRSLQIVLGGDSTAARDNAAPSTEASSRDEAAADGDAIAAGLPASRRAQPYPDPTITLPPKEKNSRVASDEGDVDEKTWGSAKTLYRDDAADGTVLAKSAPPAMLEADRAEPAATSVASDDSLMITGVITDAKTGDPIAFAGVVVEGTSKGTTTSVDGSFTIRGVAPGRYTLRVSVIGYETKTATVAVSAPTVEVVRVALNEEQATTLASQIDDARGTIDIESSTSESKAETQHQFENKATNSAPSAGSKEANVDQAGQLRVRGGRANETQVLVDGLAVTDPAARGIQGLGGGAGQTWGGVAPKLTPYAMPTPYQEPVYGGTTLPNDEVYDSMFFEHYGVNPFIPTDEDSLSTFAVDVDAASYTVARRYIDSGHLPPKEAARVEEFVNFFRQDYPKFDDVDFRIFLEGAPSPFANGYQLVRVGIKGRDIEARDRKPANLTFVIDTSGSMQREDRIELVKRALHVLLDELRPDDRVGIVAYGNEARVVLEPTSVGDVVVPLAQEERGRGDWDEDEGRAWRAGRAEIERAIDGLYPNGGTNAAAGLSRGYDMASRSYQRGSINRIILCSDGVANIGPTGGESILEAARREADRGIHLSAVGFGMGNYNDVLLEQLANKGDGNYYYVDDIDEARRVFVENLTGTLQTIAKDAKVQVEFDPQRVLRYRLLGFENRDVADQDFRNDAIDAGEIGAGHTVTALYEVKVAPSVSRGTLATVRLRYARPEHETENGSMKRGVSEISEEFDARDLAQRFADASPRFRLDAVVAEFAEILRHSYWAKESTIAALVPMARDLARERTLRDDAEVAEFASLLERAADLSAKLSPEERRALEPPPLPPGMRDGVSMR